MRIDAPVRADARGPASGLHPATACRSSGSASQVLSGGRFARGHARSEALRVPQAYLGQPAGASPLLLAAGAALPASRPAFPPLARAPAPSAPARRATDRSPVFPRRSRVLAHPRGVSVPDPTRLDNRPPLHPAERPWSSTQRGIGTLAAPQLAFCPLAAPGWMASLRLGARPVVVSYIFCLVNLAASAAIPHFLSGGRQVLCMPGKGA